VDLSQLPGTQFLNPFFLRLACKLIRRAIRCTSRRSGLTLMRNHSWPFNVPCRSSLEPLTGIFVRAGFFRRGLCSDRQCPKLLALFSSPSYSSPKCFSCVIVLSVDAETPFPPSFSGPSPEERPISFELLSTPPLASRGFRGEEAFSVACVFPRACFVPGWGRTPPVVIPIHGGFLPSGLARQ